jgi:microcystin-dependent protein
MWGEFPILIKYTTWRRDTITSTHKEGYHYINTRGGIPIHQHTRRDTNTSTHKEGYHYINTQGGIPLHQHTRRDTMTSSLCVDVMVSLLVCWCNGIPPCVLMYWYPSLCVDVLVSLLVCWCNGIPPCSIHKEGYHYINTQGGIPLHQHTRRDTITSTHKEGYQYINTQGGIPLHQHTRRDTIM